MGINKVEAKKNDKGETKEVGLVSFGIGDGEYAIDIMGIKEIIRCQKIIPIPKAPEFIEGVINLRGLVVPVIDMRKRFDIPNPCIHPKSKIIICQVEDKIIGIIVDDVSDILRLPKDSILPPPRVVKGIESEYLQGVCKLEDNLLLLLDLDRILTTTEKVILEEAKAPKKKRGKRK